MTRFMIWNPREHLIPRKGKKDAGYFSYSEYPEVHIWSLSQRISKCLHFDDTQMTNILKSVRKDDHLGNVKMSLIRQMGQNAAVTQRYRSTMFRPTWCMFLTSSSIMSGQLLSLCLDTEDDSRSWCFFQGNWGTRRARFFSPTKPIVTLKKFTRAFLLRDLCVTQNDKQLV